MKEIEQKYMSTDHLKEDKKEIDSISSDSSVFHAKDRASDILTAEKIAALTAQAGGRAYYVGGFVRDRIMGHENKDIDIEIHRITPNKIRKILSGLGSVIEVGVSFGVFGLKGCSLDIAMPRSEEATGRGHRDFDVSVDPFLGVTKAAERRDFTINAIMQDVLTGEIVDPFGGINDIEERTIRHVHPEKFAEDPLRVLRAAQFAARFQFTVARPTLLLMRQMDLSTLAKERVLGELEKALLKAPRPSVFFQILRETDQLSFWFPELRQLIGVPQDPVHHPEGDVWNHTMLVLDEAAKLRNAVKNPAGFMLAALTHDFGKILVTEENEGRIRSIGHEKEGLPLIRQFLQRLTDEKKLIRYILNLAEHHMRPNILASQHSKIKSTNKMFDQTEDPEALLLLARADHLGRTGFVPDEENERFLQERLTIYHQIMDRPFVRGEDLIAAGLVPGAEFSELLSYAHRLRLAGLEKNEALKQTLNYRRQIKKERGETQDTE